MNMVFPESDMGSPYDPPLLRLEWAYVSLRTAERDGNPRSAGSSGADMGGDRVGEPEQILRARRDVAAAAFSDSFDDTCSTATPNPFGSATTRV
jgi:hypothetical protein